MPAGEHLRGLSFQGDSKFFNRQKVADAVARRTFDSVSDPSKRYQTTQWSDGTYSCGCRGWVSHGRCKHIRMMLLGEPEVATQNFAVRPGRACTVSEPHVEGCVCVGCIAMRTRSSPRRSEPARPKRRIAL